MSPKWDERFLALAAHVATWSKDPSTQVGCVIIGSYRREVRSLGFNGFPRGMADSPERLADRELKYKLMVHAEENAILNASLCGTALDSCTVYTTLPPCTRCAASIIQAGICRVCWPSDVEVPERWRAELELAQQMMIEVGIAIR